MVPRGRRGPAGIAAAGGQAEERRGLARPEISAMLLAQTG
jgi:hypothetical protein